MYLSNDLFGYKFFSKCKKKENKGKKKGVFYFDIFCKENTHQKFKKIQKFHHIWTLILVGYGLGFKANPSTFKTSVKKRFTQVLKTCFHLMLNLS
jgi:hypothetical protein